MWSRFGACILSGICLPLLAACDIGPTIPAGGAGHSAANKSLHDYPAVKIYVKHEGWNHPERGLAVTAYTSDAGGPGLPTSLRVTYRARLEFQAKHDGRMYWSTWNQSSNTSAFRELVGNVRYSPRSEHQVCFNQRCTFEYG